MLPKIFSTLLLLVTVTIATHTMEESVPGLLDYDQYEWTTAGQFNFAEDTSDASDEGSSESDDYNEDELLPSKQLKRSTRGGVKNPDKLKFIVTCALGKQISTLKPKAAKEELQKVVDSFDQYNKEYAGSIIEAYSQSGHIQFLTTLIEQQPENTNDIIRCYLEVMDDVDKNLEDPSTSDRSGYAGLILSSDLMQARSKHKYLAGALFKFHKKLYKTYTQRDELMRAAIIGDEDTFRRQLMNENIDGINDSDVNFASTTLLVEAVNNNNLAIVKLLLKSGANVNIPSGDGTLGKPYKTAVMYAAHNGNSEMLELLLNPENYDSIEKEPDVNAHSQAGVTALMYAAENGDAACIEQLMTRNANIHASTNTGKTMLMCAAQGGNKRFVAYLLEQKIAINAKTQNKTALFFAALHGHSEVVGLLLEKGADSATVSDDGKTAFHVAAEKGYNKGVKLLFAVNTEMLDIQDSNGLTPLFYATHYSHQKVVKLLLKHGANPNRLSKNKRTALMWAVGSLQKNTKIVELLLAHGANANAINSFKRNALMEAAEGWSADIVKLLIAHTQDINAQDYENRSALLIASASHDCDEIVNVLLASGADTTLKDRSHMNALKVAKKYKHKKIIALLKKAKTNRLIANDINAPNQGV